MPEKLLSFFSRLFSHQCFTLLQFLSTKAFSSLGKSSLFTHSVENLCIMNRFGLISMQGTHISTLRVSQYYFRRWMWFLASFCSSALSKAAEAVQTLLEAFPKGQFVTFRTWDSSHPPGSVPLILVKSRALSLSSGACATVRASAQILTCQKQSTTHNLFNRRDQFLSKIYWDYTCNPITL